MTNPDISDYQIATTQVGLTNVNALATPVSDPRSTYTPYAEEIALSSGLVRGMGYPTATWSWDIISRAERDMLRTFCPGKSATVYIRTKTMDTADSYHTFQCVMVWPTQDEERTYQRRMQFKISFKTMVLIA